MTTETPSVDEARGIAVERILAATEIEDVREALSAYRQAILDEAAQASLDTIHARDEAIVLLREFAQADRVITSAGLGAGTYKRHMHPVLRDAAAFLARFPEGGEG